MRKAVLLGTVAVFTTVAAFQPRPAHAFLGGITKAIGGLFGGGEGGAAAGCQGEEDDGLLGGILDEAGDLVGAGVGAVLGGGPAGALAGYGLQSTVGGMAGQLGVEAIPQAEEIIWEEKTDPVSGCPIIESSPGMVERYMNRQRIEAIAQTVHMVTQIYHQTKMLANGDYSSAEGIVGSLTALQTAMSRVDQILYNVEGVSDQYATLYPEEYAAGTGIAEMAGIVRDQIHHANRALLHSKVVTSGSITNVYQLPNRIRGLANAVQAAEGQTSAIQAAAHGNALNTELLGQQTMMQAAHYRAVESDIDQRISEMNMATAQREMNFRCFAVYGATC